MVRSRGLRPANGASCAVGPMMLIFFLGAAQAVPLYKMGFRRRAPELPAAGAQGALRLRSRYRETPGDNSGRANQPLYGPVY